jgi:hypothetical protein
LALLATSQKKHFHFEWSQQQTFNWQLSSSAKRIAPLHPTDTKDRQIWHSADQNSQKAGNCDINADFQQNYRSREPRFGVPAKKNKFVE